MRTEHVLPPRKRTPGGVHDARVHRSGKVLGGVASTRPFNRFIHQTTQLQLRPWPGPMMAHFKPVEKPLPIEAWRHAASSAVSTGLLLVLDLSGC